MAKQLLSHNIRVNGLKAAFYCHGLSASRYIEYSAAMIFLLPAAFRHCTFLEIGCGHSILPIYLRRLCSNVVILDICPKSLRWQAEKSKEKTGMQVNVVLGDMRCLPFKARSIHRVSCISAIEHIPCDGDISAASEIGRILQDDGICVISFPLSTHESFFEQHWATGIPPMLQRIFKVCLPTILSRFNVDRTKTYFERFYSEKDIQMRIVKSSKCQVANYLTLKSGRLTKTIHQRIFPQGVITLLEYLIGRSLTINKGIESADAIVLKLEK